MEKPKMLQTLVGLSIITLAAHAGAEMISVNFWRTGAGTVPRATWQPLLTLNSNEAAGTGDWLTTGWQNYELPWAPSRPQNAVTLTGNEGSPATLVLNDVRNGGPYLWNPPRTTMVGDANANMMDGHANSTDDPGDGSNIFDIEVTDIPFETFDVIFYLGANQAQFGDGTGKASINGSPPSDFTLLSGAFNGTFTQITDPETPGNYLVYKGLGGGSFTARIWGNGFNHMGPTGMQIVESDEARQPLEISDVSYFDETGEIILTWKSNPGEFYGVYWSDDLINFKPGINAAVPANPDGPLTTFGPFPNPSPNSERLFFRLGPADLSDPTLDRVWGNGTTVNLDFSEAMQVAAATDPANFTVTQDGGTTVAITEAAIGVKPDTIVLTTATPLALDSDFSVSVNNVTDLAGRPVIGPDFATFRTWDDNPNGVKVFILAGQSNMQGHGRNEEGNGGVPGGVGSLRYQVTNDPGTYGKLVDDQNNWIARDDIKVFYRRSDLNTGRTIKKGDLLPEFGVDDARIGPEFGFGWAIADSFDEPVLIVKTCWGGKSLYADFRSPEAVAKRGGEVGDYYVGMIDYIHDALDNLATEFPEWDGLGYQIAGFGWHQGWNDGGTDFTASQYETSLADFITDIRAELGKPTLPFAIANTGIGGASASGNRLTMLEGQLAVADPALYPEFAGNIFAADTREFWRESSVSPRDQGFHWNQNGETYYLIGEAMGKGMKTLIGE
ncbi:MAG: sialate O-acetylesterase [Akkermansiaceae bacterium]|nr:sialate O-acetylesterase [Akkermansiaceae bacterium]